MFKDLISILLTINQPHTVRSTLCIETNQQKPQICSKMVCAAETVTTDGSSSTFKALITPSTTYADHLQPSNTLLISE